MKSFIGRNLVTCTEHFNISVYNLVNAGFNGKSVKSLFVRQILTGFYSRTLSILELLLIRRGLLFVPDFILGDIYALLAIVCRD